MTGRIGPDGVVRDGDNRDVEADQGEDGQSREPIAQNNSVDYFRHLRPHR